MSTSWVTERMGLAVPAGAVDRVRGIVRNVRVCGPVSVSWGRRYPAEVLAEALPKFAAVSNVGHHFDYATGRPILPVPVADVFGRIESPRMHGDGVNGDLRFNVAHSFTPAFVWAAESDPKGYCFSPLMQIEWRPQRDKDGYLVAARIVEVLSVDVVDRGGTTSTVYESWNRRVGAEIPAVVAESARAAQLRSIVNDLCTGSAPTAPVAPPRHVSAADLVAGFDPSGSSWRG
ncbi:hypothetical protein [Gemmata sp.]|uniref:hypothetical protein n=1 Tax=Gemmata sp. TaxID=1914242 RepID=UPI003F718801